MKKKILFVINTLGGAGAEMALLELLEKLEKENEKTKDGQYEISLYVLMGQGELVKKLPKEVPSPSLSETVVSFTALFTTMSHKQNMTSSSIRKWHSAQGTTCLLYTSLGNLLDITVLICRNQFRADGSIHNIEQGMESGQNKAEHRQLHRDRSGNHRPESRVRFHHRIWSAAGPGRCTGGGADHAGLRGRKRSGRDHSPDRTQRYGIAAGNRTTGSAE